MYRKVLVIVFGLLLALALSTPLKAQSTAKSDTTIVHLFSDKSEIKHSSSTLTRYDNGVSMTLHTSGLTPGDVVTAWWVIFNKPEKCGNGACGEPDLFMFDANNNMVITNNNPTLNQAQIDATQASILGATGNVIPASGEGHFSAWLGVGDVTSAVFGPGLKDPAHAVIHIVLRSHGPMQPDKIDLQMTDQWGGCDLSKWPHTPCDNVQFTMHDPAK